MRYVLIALFCFGVSNLYAGTGTAVPEERSVVVPAPAPQAVVPSTTSPKVYAVQPPTCQPAPVTIRQQRTIMEPQVSTVQVEQQVTEYVPQTRTEVVEQQVTTMVPRVIEEDVIVQQQVAAPIVWNWGYQQTYNQEICVDTYGTNRSVVRTREYDNALMALIYAKRALTQMERSGSRPGEIRRARRTVARLAFRLKSIENQALGLRR